MLLSILLRLGVLTLWDFANLSSSSTSSTCSAFQVVVNNPNPNPNTAAGGGVASRRRRHLAGALLFPHQATGTSVIESDAVDFEFDEGSGGVRLARESVIALRGTVRHKPGQADPQVSELRRYTKLTEVVDAAAVERYVQVLGTGIGTESYADPGETAATQVTLAPADAVRDCLMGVASALDLDKVCINFAGGSDAQVPEVLTGVKEMVLDLDVKTKCEIVFHSLSHHSLPEGKSFLTVVGLSQSETSAGGLKGVERALASGEVYFCNGQYWTVTDENANTDVA